MEKPNFKKMCLMYIQQLTNFPYIEKDFDALTDYGLLCKIVEYLNKVITNNNIQNETVTNLYNAFVALKDYVDNYFDNLDVQDEINNKLDEMAQDGTLEDIVKDYLNNKCEFIFPGRWGYHTSGNSNIVRYRNKVILFDTHNSWAYSYLKLMLFDYNITHIDYMIISHFDTDHRINLQSLIEDGFIDENTVYYHPACPIEIYPQSILDWYNNIESICNARNITSIIPNEKQIVKIFDDFELKFGNCDTAYTIANYTDANQASMIVEINHNGFKTLMMGDAQPSTLERLYNENFITGEVQFYTIPHHAINTATYTPFYEIVRPQMAVAQVQMEDFNRNKLVQNQASALLNDMGCINYYGCMNEENLYFVEQMGVLTCLIGKPHSTVGKYVNATNIYVNASVVDDAVQDGTESHPYRDLSQAVGCVADYPNRHINIILAPGHYGTLNPGGSAKMKNRINIFNWKNIITITTSGTNEDTFIDDGISINNCFKVKIENVTILTTTERSYGAYINNSNVYFNNCIIRSEDTTKHTYGIQLNEWSKAEIRGCTFSYLYNAISCRNNSVVNMIANNCNNLSRILDVDSTAIVNIHSNGTMDYTTIDDINNYNPGAYPNVENVQAVSISNSKMLNVINLPFKVNNVYHYIEFDYELRWNNNQVGRNRLLTRLADLPAFDISDFNLQPTGSLKVFSCFIDISYTNGTLTITRNTAGSIDNGVMTTHNPADEDTADYGVKITNIRLY